MPGSRQTGKMSAARVLRCERAAKRRVRQQEHDRRATRYLAIRWRKASIVSRRSLSFVSNLRLFLGGRHSRQDSDSGVVGFLRLPCTVFRRFSVPYLQLGGRKTCERAAAFKLSPNEIEAQLLGLGLEVRRILEDTAAHFLRIDDCNSGERRSAVKNSRHHPRPFQKLLTITPSPGK